MISNGLPTLATCAGLILLSEHIADDDIVHIGTLPVTIDMLNISVSYKA